MLLKKNSILIFSALSLGMLVIILMFSCSGSKNITAPVNQAGLYNPGIAALHPDYLIFHQNDTVSQLFVRLLAEELLFNEANKEHKRQAVIKVKYILRDSTADYKNQVIIDSMTVVRHFSSAPNRKAIFFAISFKAPANKNYNLEIVLTDVLHYLTQTTTLAVNKINRFSGQNFNITKTSGEIPFFRTYFSEDETVHISYADIRIQKLYLSFQHDNTGIPQPPSVISSEQDFHFKADSSWTLDSAKLLKLSFPYRGIYLIHTDTSNTEGFLVTNFGRSYPRIKDPELMIPPLQYITNIEEYNHLCNAPNAKLAVDNFWLKLTSNTNQARELIRIFYTRQMYANYFFADYREGWQTDRGMIYMIYGPADIIRKTPNAETWIYGSTDINASMTVKFTRKENLNTGNCFVMNRSDAFATPWKNAINSWRKGKVFVFTEE